MIGPMAYLGKEDNFRQFCYNYDIQQFGIFFDNPSSKADKVQLFYTFLVTIAKEETSIFSRSCVSPSSMKREAV